MGKDAAGTVFFKKYSYLFGEADFSSAPPPAGAAGDDLVGLKNFTFIVKYLI
jgi:hypothetical protein